MRTVEPVAAAEPTVKRFDGTGCASSNVAVTDLAASIVTVQVDEPEQAPPQPENSEPEAAEAESVTDVPESNSAEQEEPQSMPAGEEVTVPEPVPALAVVRAKRTGGIGGEHGLEVNCAFRNG